MGFSCVHFLRLWHVALPAAFCRVQNYRKYENQLQREVPEIPSGRRFFWHQHGDFEMKKIKRVRQRPFRFITYNCFVSELTWWCRFSPHLQLPVFLRARQEGTKNHDCEKEDVNNNNNNILKKKFVVSVRIETTDTAIKHNHLSGIDGGALEEPLNAPRKPPF